MNQRDADAGMTTVQRLIALAAQRFGKPAADLAPDADIFEILGIDSVQVLELLSEIELTFEVEIPDYELRDIKTFAELAAQIDKRR